MPKNYSIKFLIDDKSASAAWKRGVAGMESIEKAALKAAKAMEAAHTKSTATVINGYASMGSAANGYARGQAATMNGVATAAVSTTKKKITDLEALELKWSVRDYRIRVKAEKDKERLDDFARSRNEKRIKGLEGIEQKYLVDDYKRRVKAEKDKEKLAAAELSNRQKMFDKAEKAEHDREVRAAKRAEAFALGPNGRLAAGGTRKALTAQQLDAAAAARAMDVLNKKAVDARLAAMGLKDSFAEGIAQGLGFSQIATLAGGVAAAVGGAAIAGRALSSAFLEAQQNAKEMARHTLDTMAALRALASVRGVQSDKAFSREVAAFNVQTGFGAGEGKNFLENFRGRAQIATQGANATISPGALNKFEVKAGQLAVAKGIPADVAGDLFGGVVKAENFKKFGNDEAQASAALARAAGALKILDAGTGQIPILGKELNQVVAALTKEDKLEGAFRNIGEAAVATSVAAEYNPNEAGTTVERTVDALSDFTDKNKQPFFKKSGINEKDSFLEAIAKANTYIEGEMARTGKPLKSVLDEAGFKEKRENRGLRTFFGARNTVLKPQLENLAKAQGPNAAADANAVIAGAQGLDTTRDAVSQAKLEQAKLVEGEKATELLIARQKAEAELVSRGLDTDPAWTAAKFKAGAFTGFTKTGRDVLIEERAMQNLQGEAGQRQDFGVTSGIGMYSGLVSALKQVFGDNAASARHLKEIADNTKQNRVAPPVIPVGGPPAGPLRP